MGYNDFAFSLKKRIKTDEQFRNAYFKVKENLPKWLDKNIHDYDVLFLVWCNNNPDIFKLIVNDLLSLKSEYIPVTLEVIKGDTVKDIAAKHNVKMSKAQWRKRHVLRKVLSVLKTIYQYNNDKYIYDINGDNLNSDIKSLGLPTRTYNTLIRNNLFTIAQLEQLTYQQLKNIRNFGEISIIQIEEALGIKYQRDEQAPAHPDT
ncbi:hypothetical protein CAL7716_059920 [Calothrix sp. PCC 7716]|nr:hypothetical protein CAL7716_059920 [Calothrix sp. PCC 7716]